MTMLLLAQWDVGCWGMTLNSIPLRPASLRPFRASVGASLQRHKRNWVWNQFFVLEEYTGDDPLYVGKLHSDVDKGDGKVKYVLNGEGTSVVEVKATDADDPTYGNSARVVYSILEGQPYFSVEPKTGIVRTALPNMDREARDQYLLVIQAKDMVGQMGGLSGTTSVTVTLTDVNDNPPRFSRKSYQFAVPESLPVASVVAKIKALDSDIGPNAEMDYRIIEGDGLGVFRVASDKDTQEGVITLQKNLDFETKSSYTLKIEVSNRNIDPRFLSQGPFSDTAMVRLTVENVDEPPIFSTPLSKMGVSEAAKVGTIIGTVSALDPDSTNSPIRYSIDRNTDLERFFNIEATTGVISTAKPLDREANAVHNITILAIKSCE
ncbi:hypothetical protein cypCar_00023665 [Cyprinus carpio]|nr:hypothetical protein cypCar_00023665 [Cyprinus carpio]